MRTTPFRRAAAAGAFILLIPLVPARPAAAAITTTGAGGVLVWGDQLRGPDGATASPENPTVPVALGGEGAAPAAAVSAGFGHSLILRGDGSVLSWGRNELGQLGDGTGDARATPVPVSGLGVGSGVVAVSAGGEHNLALRSDGSVLAWGEDQSGQLGDDGAFANQSTPVPVSGLGAGSGVVAVEAGAAHSLALRSDGSVLAWGNDVVGQLGDGGANAGQPTPVAVTGLGAGSGVVALAADRGNHSLAVTSDGSVLAWGWDDTGQLGDGGAEADQPTPVPVSGLGPGSGVVAVSGGFLHSLALKADGTVLAWGFRAGPAGEDGISTTTSTPVGVPGLGAGSAVVAVAAGSLHRLALRADGSVWAWGSDGSGQLGDGGANADQPTPVPVSGLGAGSRVTAISAGVFHSVALVGPRRPVVSDFDGDGATDRAVYRDGAWYVEGQPTVFLGLPDDAPVPGDYDGDGTTDRAVYREGAWYVEGEPTVFFGLPGDVPVPGDYDGNGTTDRAVYRKGAWYVEGQPTLFLGLTNDTAVPGDYDGDGTTDQAVYRHGTWYIEGQATIFHGLPGYIPVPGDYDGNGTTDPAVYKTGAWHVPNQPTVNLQTPETAPQPGDYDGDGTTDPAVYDGGAWYVEGEAPVFLGLQLDYPLPLPHAILIRIVNETFVGMLWEQGDPRLAEYW